MASLANQTNINTTRYFFATQEAGEQILNTETQAAGNLTDFYVSISGPAGNAVQINQMPDIIGTVTTGGEEMLYAGTASTYKTLSSLSQTATGISMSTDRIPGSGIATIESYASNGPFTGFEFLSRSVNGELISTTSAGINTYMSTIGRPGATAVLGGSGTLVAGTSIASQITSINTPDNTGAGTGVFNINDLSGVGGTTPQARWSIYKYGPQSDLALGAYDDSGNFITAPIQVRRSDGATALNNVSSINGVAFDVSGILPWTVYPVLNTGTQSVALTAGVPQTVLTFDNIPYDAQGTNAGGLFISVPIAVQNTSLTNPAIVNLAGYFGGNTSGGTGVHACCVLSSNLNNQIVTLSGVATHNGTTSTVTVTAVSDTSSTFDFTQGTSAFHKFYFQYVDG